jgi:hypothetical protein
MSTPNTQEMCLSTITTFRWVAATLPAAGQLRGWDDVGDKGSPNDP